MNEYIYIYISMNLKEDVCTRDVCTTTLLLWALSRCVNSRYIWASVLK